MVGLQGAQHVAVTLCSDHGDDLQDALMLRCIDKVLLYLQPVHIQAGGCCVAIFPD